MLVALLAALTLAGVVAAPARAAAPAPPARLTNLAHLDFLGDRVDPPEQAGHTTWRMDREPEIGVLWTYAEPQPDGSYRRLGGGTYDPATNTWGQGAFNADDMTRRRWCTCATGASSATTTAATRPTSCCGA